MDLRPSRRRYIRDRGRILQQIFEAWIRIFTMLVMGKRFQGEISCKIVGGKEVLYVFKSDSLRFRVPDWKVFWIFCGRLLFRSLLLSGLIVRLRSAYKSLFGPNLNQLFWSGDGG